MKICVRTHDLGKGTCSFLAKEAKKYHFEGIQLVIGKAIEGETGDPGTLTSSKAKQIANDFKKEGIEIAMLGAYFNPVHSNKELVSKSIKKFKEHLLYAKDFGCQFVGSETGSYNDDKWTYHPNNRTEEAFQEVKTIFKDLADYAKEVNSNLALEGAFGHCCYEPSVLKKLFDAIDNGHVFATIDIFNYLSLENYTSHTKIFDDCLELFKDKIVIFHLKDFIVGENKLVQVGLGQGLMNYEYILPKIKKYCPNAYLIFEGVKPEDMESSMTFVQKLL